MSVEKVQLYIYDLSMGMAAQLSPMFLGKRIEGIWHTGVVVYGQEFFYGGMGIESCPPGGTIMGPPHKIEDLGTTEVPFDLFAEYLHSISPDFKPDKYDLLENNCNSFSNVAAQFLTGKELPPYIIDLPKEVMTTPFGQQLKPFLQMMSGGAPGGANSQYWNE